VHVLEKLNIANQHLSFDSAVSQALKALLESARHANLIPESDGFEYSELMRRYTATKADFKERLQFTKLINSASPDHRSPMLPVADDPARAKRRIRWEELKLKNEAEGMINFSDDDTLEFAKLQDEFLEGLPT